MELSQYTDHRQLKTVNENLTKSSFLALALPQTLLPGASYIIILIPSSVFIIILMNDGSKISMLGMHILQHTSQA